MRIHKYSFDFKKCIQKKRRGCFVIDKMGFTLIEMLIMIAIVALLAAAAYTTVDPNKRLGEAKDSKRLADLIAVSKAIDLYAADNGSLPSDFDVSNISNSKKIVLCSSSGQRTCNGQTRDCLVVDDSSFLQPYLGGVLPIDPEKSSVTDTGYYISRGFGDSIVLGACSHFKTEPLKIVSGSSMPPLVAVCGDGDIEDDEICDDGNTITEGCGNGEREDAGIYCNATCTATTTIAQEVCDYDVWAEDCWTGFEWYAEVNDGAGAPFCNSSCTNRTFSCLPPP